MLFDFVVWGWYGCIYGDCYVWMGVVGDGWVDLVGVDMYFVVVVCVVVVG